MLLCTGFLAGRLGKPPAPPLIIDRSRTSPLADNEGSHPANDVSKKTDPTASADRKAISNADDAVYICGARTKKGTPCSRRVHGPVRCWQHKGSKAMMPDEKLLVKD